ncbi:hypothetical protein [Akkermansia glycaniphila]|uniref:Uncharacterized protein n=1 Tax=Akkermansia glycaniphila TaxID=1679444 RepID=A0A1C7PFH1_9BACT|nr:hypothetical protein [Akkermansia glycaniphila]OCA02316.1 hypothetical protein AC781_10820 [Akkermansia glycaniphila]OCA04198.1 hypothetical protein AC781_00450 [Akkermansia glycaniphila]SEH87583.1 Hypothetical protein PYTT_1383 [Akkermansia glycaniphila]
MATKNTKQEPAPAAPNNPEMDENAVAERQQQTDIPDQETNESAAAKTGQDKPDEQPTGTKPNQAEGEDNAERLILDGCCSLQPVSVEPSRTEIRVRIACALIQSPTWGSVITDDKHLEWMMGRVDAVADALLQHEQPSEQES